MLTEQNILATPPHEDKHNLTENTFTLEDKYTKEEGWILLSGVQAIVRLPLDQHRADKRRGLNTATLVSGYRGSPLGSLDMTIQQSNRIMKEHQVHLLPAINEELGATAIFGSQTANMLPDPKYDGVLGMWYGKAPGVDRSGDIFKHANFTGVGRNGGVLALAGDDPISKSSTLPSHSEVTLYDALFPVLYPGSTQDILDLGRLGFELSRFSGLWVGFKIVTNVADEFSIAQVSPDRVIIETPEFSYNGKTWQHNQNTRLLTPYSLAMEREIHDGRLEAAKLFATANGINCITVPTSDAWLGIIAAGKTYYDVRQALHELGLEEEQLHQYGIRLLKIGMMFPMEPQIIHEFSQGLEEILIIEEKRAFMEFFIRDILYHRSERPNIIGKRDEFEKAFISPHGELDVDKIAQIIAKRISQRIPLESIQTRLQQIQTPVDILTVPLLPRSPFFCSGCPHNSSTVLPEGSLAGAGIGCHTMTLLSGSETTIGLTQMGGEGVQWVGASQFSNLNHMFQNIGDGTLFHSGSLAIRQSIAAKVNITYKILYNSAVAMTGGQDADGAMPVPELTHALKAEGVGKIIVTSDEPDKYAKGTKWAEGVEIWHRDRLDEAQSVLREIPGVTILIHDQECAAELRRKRKRGLAPEPEMRVFINEAVCEGCGDCGVKSNCLSVFPVETEFGRKTQIHQSSCNKDYSCLKGDCPAFITIIPGEQIARREYDINTDLPEPEYHFTGEWNVYMMGIGGTGVVTTNQILATAAMLDGKFVRGLDQTGLSQKGGPVVANLRLLNDYHIGANKVSAGAADCYLVFDLLSASDPVNLSRARRDRTTAVISTSEIPTGSMVISTAIKYPGEKILLNAIDRNTRQEDNFRLDATVLSELLFGSAMSANMIVVGAAYQRGLLPISANAIEEAIKLNGAAIKANTQAFRAGRRVVAQPDWIQTLNFHRPGTIHLDPVVTPKAQVMIEAVGAEIELSRLLQIRVPELIDYQNSAYAQQYVDFVKHVIEVEKQLEIGDTRLSEAVARYLFKLMAYKDEYEVARLHMKSEVKQSLEDGFGAKATASYMLHPPLLRSLGLKNKLKLGQWFDHVYRLMMTMKGLRGTPLDIFGYAEVRRVERQLIQEYRGLIERALKNLTAETYDRVVELASLPDMIRGYEQIKLGNVKKFHHEVKRLGFE